MLSDYYKLNQAFVLNRRSWKFSNYLTKAFGNGSGLIELSVLLTNFSFLELSLMRLISFNSRSLDFSLMKKYSTGWNWGINGGKYHILTFVFWAYPQCSLIYDSLNYST